MSGFWGTPSNGFKFLEVWAKLPLNSLHLPRLSEPYASTSAVLGYEFHTRSFHCGAHLTDAAKARIIPKFESVNRVCAHFSRSSQIGDGPTKCRARHTTLDRVHSAKLPPKRSLTQKEIYYTI